MPYSGKKLNLYHKRERTLYGLADFVCIRRGKEPNHGIMGICWMQGYSQDKKNVMSPFRADQLRPWEVFAVISGSSQYAGSHFHLDAS